jgi:hypothetical protein
VSLCMRCVMYALDIQYVVIVAVNFVIHKVVALLSIRAYFLSLKFADYLSYSLFYYNIVQLLAFSRSSP